MKNQNTAPKEPFDPQKEQVEYEKYKNSQSNTMYKKMEFPLSYKIEEKKVIKKSVEY